MSGVRHEDYVLAHFARQLERESATQLQELKRAKREAQELREALKRCAKERKDLIEGIVHAECEITAFRNKYFDEDPGDEGQPGSPEYEKLREVEAHLSGCCIDSEGEYMKADRFDSLARPAHPSEQAQREAK